MLTNTPHGCHLEFANGLIISVKCVPMNYCSNGKAFPRVDPFDGDYHEFESNTAEIAVFHKVYKNMYPLSDHDDVKGWLTADEVAKYILWTSRLDSDYHKVMAKATKKGLGSWESDTLIHN